MRSRIISALIAAVLLGTNQFGAAQTIGKITPNAAVLAIKAKVVEKARKATAEKQKLAEADLTEEFKALDDIIAADKTDLHNDAASALSLKSSIYASLVKDYAKAIKLNEQIKTDYPNSDLARKMNAAVERELKQKKIQDGLAIGVKFPDFAEKDLNGKPLSPANYKGKVLLIDFWSTWSKPCVKELPNVLAAYEKYHDQGFEIIGINLDEAVDKNKLAAFIEEHKISWPQYFDGKRWENKLALKYSVTTIPARFLLDGEGNIIGRDLRGKALEEALAKVLKKG